MLCYTSVILLGLDARILSSDEYGSNCNVRYNFLSFVLKKLPNDYRPTKAKKHLANHKVRKANFILSRQRGEWLPNLPSQGLMTKTHDYLH